MKAVWLYLLFVLSFWFSPQWVCAQDEFAKRWELEKVSPMSGMREEVLHTLKERQVLFISGFGNEFNYFYSVYYKTSQETVESELGMKATYYGPSSWYSENKSAECLYKKILKISEETSQPLVLVAHSKGGAAVLYLILKHSDLILKNIVDRVVLIQAPIGGCAFLSEPHKNFMSTMTMKFWGDSVKEMKEAASQQRFEKAFQEFKFYLKQEFGSLGDEVVAQKQKEISDKIFYLRSYKEKGELSIGVRILWKIFGINLDSTGQKNDGLLLSDAQKFKPELEEFGVDLGIVQADHIELTSSGVFCGASENDRRAFTRALFEQIYEPASAK